MTSLEFVYWLQGFLEISKPETISKEQIEIINQHISLVLIHVSANYATIDPTKKQELIKSWEELIKKKPKETSGDWILNNSSYGPQPEKRYFSDDNMFKVHHNDSFVNKDLLNSLDCSFPQKVLASE